MPMTEDCVHKQPSSSMCLICGRDNPIGLRMEFYDNGDNRVVSHCTPDSRFQSYPGIVHGGILATILDEAVGRVAMIGDHHHFMMTVNLKAQYRQPVPVDSRLRVVAEAIRMGGRIGRARGEIYLPDGTLACEAELTLANMPGELAGQRRLDALDWAVD